MVAVRRSTSVCLIGCFVLVLTCGVAFGLGPKSAERAHRHRLTVWDLQNHNPRGAYARSWREEALNSDTADDPIDDQIEAIAHSPEFNAVFAGDTVDPSTNEVTVYVTSAGVTQMEDALSALGPLAPGAYTVVVKPLSEAQLEAGVLAISDSPTTVSGTDYTLTSWAPDPSTNTVKVSVQGDTASATAALDALGLSVPFSVVGGAQGFTADADGNRYYDNCNPCRGGDRVDVEVPGGYFKCTDGFSFIGNKSGDSFLTTAGHCGDGNQDAVENDGGLVGYISTNYLNYGYEGGQLDFSTLTCFAGCSAYVWIDQPSIGHAEGTLYGVGGECACDSGVDVTIDGASSGEQPDFQVQSVDGCVHENNTGINACGVNTAYRSTAGCQDGDSGGPVYQREPDSDARATGVEVASGGSPSGTSCAYTELGIIQNTANISLKTTS